MAKSQQLTIPQAIKKAKGAIKQGNISAAQQLYSAVLQLQPNHPIAKKGLRKLVKNLPRKQSVQTQISNPSQEQINDLTNLYYSGQIIKTEQVCKEFLQTFPQSLIVNNVLGAALKGQGKLQEAVQAFDKAIQIKPDYAVAYYNRGVALNELGQLKEAVDSYNKAIQIKPDYAEAYSNRGNALKEIGQLKEAVNSYNKAIQIKPDYAVAYYNRGVTLKEIGQLKEAVDSYNKAIQIKPDYADAYYNRGVALNELGQLKKAVDSYNKAIQIKPDYADAYSNRGKSLIELGQLEEAVRNYDKAIQLKPDYAETYSNLLFALNYSISHPFADRIAMASRFGRLFAEKVRSGFSEFQCQPRPERLRVGFVSGDLCRHSVGYFLESVVSSINSKAIELIAYPTHPKTDDLSVRIKPFFSAWKPIYALSDEAAASLIYADKIHILIDLSGHTAHNRLPMFCWKPSPVQVTWLGYCATTGLSEMDYFIGDSHTLLPNIDSHFTEKVWRLPNSYICFTAPDVLVEVAAPPALKNRYITFGSFNNLSKMNDEVIAIWAKVLEMVPNSRLFLKTKQLEDISVHENVIQRFAAHRVKSERLILKGRVEREKHFAAYNEIDIALDPFPYQGVTTSFESLWMGVPVLTLAGDHFLSRQGVGILMNAGLPDWIATDKDEYVAKAAAFASDIDGLAALRAGLRTQVLASPLFNAQRFAKNFEDALWQMWQCRYQPNHSVQTQRIDPSQDQINTLTNLYHSGQITKAEQVCKELLQTFPQSLFVINVLGAALKGQGKLQEAVQAFDKAIQIKPDYAEAYSNRGVALKELGQLKEAVDSCNKAIQIKPDYAEAYYNRGNALKELGQLKEAIDSCNKAIQIKPNYAKAYCNRGNVLKDLGQMKQAVESYEKAIQFKPNFFEAHSNLLFTLNYLADQPSTKMFEEARHFGDLTARQALPYRDWRKSPESDQRLRVGLVSGDLRTHSVGFFVEGILAALASNNSSQLKIIVYQNHSLTDALTERVKTYCHGWHSVVDVSDENLARQIHDDGIDILIDLSGHTAFNRLPMFAWKPAPVQVSWMGYPNTTGVSAIDYRFVDSVTDPPGDADRYHTEKLIRLPHCFLCYRPPLAIPAIKPPPCVDNRIVTFGSFNNLAKISPQTISVWVALLKKVPNATLILKSFSIAEDKPWKKLIQRFAEQGIDPDRIKTFPKTSKQSDHLDLYNKVDIALDTFPYNGTTTTCEALWMGVPVIALLGDRHAARVSASLLKTIGLSELVAKSTEDFVKIGTDLAQDVERLKTLRNTMRTRMDKSPLQDEKHFAAIIEQALRKMWEIWCKGETPRVFEVTSDKTYDLSNIGVETDPATQTLSGEDEPVISLDLSSTADSAIELNIRGEELFAQGKVQEAKEIFEKALRENPHFAVVHNNLGVLQWHLGNAHTALKHLTKSLSLEPGNNETLENIEAVFQQIATQNLSGKEDSHHARNHSLSEKKQQAGHEQLTTVCETWFEDLPSVETTTITTPKPGGKGGKRG